MGRGDLCLDAWLHEVEGPAETEPLTNIEALELDRMPERLIVIGGGYMGLEFAQAHRRLEAESRFSSGVRTFWQSGGTSKRTFHPKSRFLLNSNYIQPSGSQIPLSAESFGEVCLFCVEKADSPRSIFYKGKIEGTVLISN